ncbi:MAG: hypothetical protein H0X31_10010 [Nostocaceae cyanobacterium]|nr:hypothetical protein [Nostocaceae cyanobacterium]
MIISDLNHLEVVSEANSVLGGFTQGGSTNISFNENFNLNKYIKSNVNITGHAATVESDATATGSGTLTQVFTNSNTTPYSSSSSGTSISATSGYRYW